MPECLLHALDFIGCLSERPFGKRSCTCSKQGSAYMVTFVSKSVSEGKLSSSEHVFIKDVKWGGKQKKKKRPVSSLVR